MYQGCFPLCPKSLMGPLLRFMGAVGLGVTAGQAVGTFVDKAAVKTFTTSCFIEFSTNGELWSASTPFSLVLPASTSLASAGEITVTTPGCTSRFSWHEDLISEICKLAGVSKGELLMSMKELSGGLVVVDTRIRWLRNPKKALPIYGSRLQNEANHKCITGVE